MKLVPVHVIAAAIALVSGFIALYAFKGGALHRKTGTIFAYAMLVLSLSGAVMAVGRAGAAVNIAVGLVTAYLVVTSLATVRPSSAGSQRLNRAAMVAFFLGPVRRIPEPLRMPALRLIPLVVLVTMVYWLWRLRRKRNSRDVIGVSALEAI
jgi:uncharacterized membrane protein